MPSSTLPSVPHVDNQDTINLPPKRGPLGLKRADLGLHESRKVDLSSLLLAGLTIEDPASAVVGILDAIADDLVVHHYALRNEDVDLDACSSALFVLSRRCRVALELCRRYMAEAHETTQTGEKVAEAGEISIKDALTYLGGAAKELDILDAFAKDPHDVLAAVRRPLAKLRGSISGASVSLGGPDYGPAEEQSEKGGRR